MSTKEISSIKVLKIGTYNKDSSVK